MGDDLLLKPYDPDHDMDLAGGELARIRDALNDLRARQARLTGRREDLIVRLSAQGVPTRDLMALTGLTRARVHAIRRHAAQTRS